MAFKRSNFKSLINTKKEFFASSYGFSKKTNFKAGSDVYVLPLGLETGFYETPCHRILPHKVDGKLIGFNGFQFAVNVKCKGIDAEGNLTSSLCCELAKMEKQRFPGQDEFAKRIVSSRTNRIHLPVLILGNSLDDDSKIAYPVSKVAIKKDLASESGLKFSFIEMSASTFRKDILNAYGKKLQEEGTLDYDLDENSEEFMEAVVEKLSNTVIRVHGGTKQGFSAAMKEYSFFPFDNPGIASKSPEGERELIINYRKNTKIAQQVSEYLTLFDAEVDGLILDWTEKDLQEYYNSAIGVPLDTPLEAIASVKSSPVVAEVVTEPEEEVVVKKAAPKPQPVAVGAGVSEEVNDIDIPTGELTPPASDEEIQKFIDSPFEDEDTVSEGESTREAVEELDEFEFDSDGEDDFWN